MAFFPCLAWARPIRDEKAVFDMATFTTNTEPELESQGVLASWKGIAAYFGCNVRTAKRWERGRGLPVRRAPGKKGGTVFACASELDAWLESWEDEQMLDSRRVDRRHSGSPGRCRAERFRNGGRHPASASHSRRASGKAIFVSRVATVGSCGFRAFSFSRDVVLEGGESSDGRSNPFLSIGLVEWKAAHRRSRRHGLVSSRPVLLEPSHSRRIRQGN